MYEDTLLAIEKMPTEGELTNLIREMLDANGSTGGTIRSSLNCKAVVFGQDGQAMMAFATKMPRRL